MYSVAQWYVCSGNLIVFNQNSFVFIKSLRFTFVYLHKDKKIVNLRYIAMLLHVYIHIYLYTCASNVNAQAVACAHVFAS